jgi:1-deoxy-D-xylulose-5-phosphate reductoisomerase
VLNAMTGSAGLPASLAALEAGTRLALANKESLVVGGDLLMPLARDGELIPVDSEHSAVFQCLQGESPAFVSRLWITCSGGPFLGSTRAELAHATPQATLAHPTWHMGREITVDSATLMNKGYEVIEAHQLFDVAYDDIRVVIHPQSRIHSMVEFRDGSVKAHLGATDMRIPIQYALSYPERWKGIPEPLDFTQLAELTFAAPDTEVFRCLGLALEAGRKGGTGPCVLNAANEVAVDAFLRERCSFTDIDYIIETALESQPSERVSSLQQLREVDARARKTARQALDRVRR